MTQPRTPFKSVAKLMEILIMRILFFYAEGVDVYNQESLTNINLYDTKSYYYITVQGTDGKELLQ
jgi:hypothetical protein